MLRLVATADVFLEAFRPGVIERLGVGPDEVLAAKPDIVYGRLTGSGQMGRLSSTAGHSLSYEAITGVIDAIGPRDGGPAPLLQILGDFAGGGLTMAFGVVCAVGGEAVRSGARDRCGDDRRCRVDCLYVLRHAGEQPSPARTGLGRGSNLFDGGAPFFDVCECADGRYLSCAPIEPRFYAQFLDQLGLAGADLPNQYDRARWPDLRSLTADVIRIHSRDDWTELFAPTDCCVAPVLTFDEARSHGHHLDRGTFLGGSNTQAGPELAVIPRLSRTPGDAGGASPAWLGADTGAVLGAAGWNAEEISSLRARGIAAG